jgi:hypothetical protein
VQLVPYFSKFGRVVGFEADSSSDEKKNRSARVGFSNHSEARSAISSVEAVLGNRFIQVKWGPPTEQRPLPAVPVEDYDAQAALGPGGVGLGVGGRGAAPQRSSITSR